MSEQIGKIYNNKELIYIFNTIIKTSKSGFFNNKRLAILSIKQGIIGYNSKQPNNLSEYKDLDCLNTCKQICRIRHTHNFTYYLKPDNPSILNLKWKEQNVDKQWQFKFDTEQIAKIWYNYIYQFINNDIRSRIQKQKDEQNKKKQNPLKISLGSPSRFKQFQEKISPINDDNNHVSSFLGNDSILKRRFTDHQIENGPDKNTANSYLLSHNMKYSRFAKYEQENNIKDHYFVSAHLPITTFKQKFPNEQFFIPLQEESQIQMGQNWNILWFETTEKGIQENTIIMYQRFVSLCQKICKEIINQLTMLTKNRKYIPKKITNHEQIYNEGNITYYLMMEREFPDGKNKIYSEFKLRERREILQNYKFILKATRNRNIIKVPLACIIQSYGFSFFCQANLPFNYFQVQHTSKHYFLNHISKLEDDLKLRINTVDFNFCTNKLGKIPNDSKSKQTYLIVKDLKNILPMIKSLKSQNYYQLQKQTFLQSREISTNSIKDDNFYINLLKKNLHNFVKTQNQQCKIISHEDLLQSIKEYKLSYAQLDDILSKTQNIYLIRIIKTQFVSEIFCKIVRSQCMVFVNQWNNKPSNRNREKHQAIDTDQVIRRLVDQLLTESHQNNTLWTIIHEELFVNHEVNVKQQELIIGYLLTSISYKIGIQFDYQYFIQQRQTLFTKDFNLQRSAFKTYKIVKSIYLETDISNLYSQIQYKMYGPINQSLFDKIIIFFGLKSKTLQNDSYFMNKIYRYLSYFIPYGQKPIEYSHLTIYKNNNLLYLDYNIYSIFVSSIKWSLFAHQYKQTIELLELFLSYQWFWLSQINSFTPKILQIMANYNKINNNIQESIKYMTKSLQLQQKRYIKYSDLYCVQNNLELAILLNHYNYHKESLQKYLQIRKVYKKYKRQDYRLVDISVQISRLYLHLGDVQACIKFCKETIQISVLNMFKDQLHQYEIYEILLRALQIKDIDYKYKIYLSIIQDKFQSTNSPILLQKVMKLSIQQILNTFNQYKLKKFMFYLYNIQADQQDNKPINLQDRFNLMKLYTIKLADSIFAIMRKCMEIIVDLSDYLTIQQEDEQSKKKIQMKNMAAILQILCGFIGFQFLVGLVVQLLERLKTNDF